MPQDAVVAARGDRETAVAVMDKKRPVGKRQGELAGLEHVAIEVGQDGEKHLVAQLGPKRRPPGDIEVRGIAGSGAILQDVVPPGVVAGADAHVIGHGIENLAHAVVVQGADPLFIIFGGADLRIERCRDR